MTCSYWDAALSPRPTLLTFSATSRTGSRVGGARPPEPRLRPVLEHSCLSFIGEAFRGSELLPPLRPDAVEPGLAILQHEQGAPCCRGPAAPADAGSPQPAGPVVTCARDALRSQAHGQAEGVFSVDAVRSSRK